MKLYIYSEKEIAAAFDKIQKEYELTYTTAQNWMCINIKSTDKKFFQISYPYASLWHQKVETISKLPSVPAEEAKFFIVPVVLFSHYDVDANAIMESFCGALTHWNVSNIRKHVFFDSSDIVAIERCLNNSIVFKVSCHKKKHYLPIHYDILLDTSLITPIDSAIYRCSFVGCLDTYPLRNNLPMCIDAINGKTFIEGTPNFFDRLNESTMKKMQVKWTGILNESRFILCPRGNGLTSIRFFETMAFGRIPVLIADNTKLPLTRFIDYDGFTVFVPEKDILIASRYIDEFEKSHDINKASNLARAAWLKYFSPGGIEEFLKYSLSPSNIQDHLPRRIFI